MYSIVNRLQIFSTRSFPEKISASLRRRTSTAFLGLLSFFLSGILFAAPQSVMNSDSGKSLVYQCSYHTKHTHGLVNLLTVSVDSDCFASDPDTSIKDAINGGEIDDDLSLPEMTRCSLIRTPADSLQGIDSASYKILFDYIQNLPHSPSEEEQVSLNYLARSHFIANLKWKTIKSSQKSCHSIFALESEQWAVNSATTQTMKIAGLAYLLSGLRSVHYLITSYTHKFLPDISSPYLPWINIKGFSLEQVLITLGVAGIYYGIQKRKTVKFDVEKAQ